MNKPTFEQVAAMGFNFPQARQWIDRGEINQLAQDAALITTPNTTVPVELLAYIDPMVIEILTAPRRAREVFDETKKGDIFTTAYAKWRIDEMVGRTQPYSDFAHAGVSDVNSNWANREQYEFQTTIQYGDKETAVSGVAKINLASAKQISAATILDIDSNRFYLLGVEGRNIYGLLNDPNLLPAIAPLPGTGGLTWATKTADEKYNDVRALYDQLAAQGRGYITRDTPMKLLLSPERDGSLATTSLYNQSTQAMIVANFPNTQVVVLPELSTPVATDGQTMMLIAPHLLGTPTGELSYGAKVVAGRVIPELSSMKQKWISSTYGAIIHRPFAIATMEGI